MPKPALEDVLPLTPLQEGLLYHAVYTADDIDVYTVQTLFRFTGPVDTTALRTAACETVFERHPNLRAGFLHEGVKQPVQFIVRTAVAPWREVDLGATAPAEREAALERVWQDERHRRFNLAKPPLFRYVFVRLDDEHSALLSTSHHILADGWSLGLFKRELLELYRGTEPAALPEVRPFRDYLAWLRDRDQAADLAAWQEALSGFTEPTLVARPDPDGRNVVSVPLTEHLSGAEADAVTALTRTARVTANTVFSTAWAMALGALVGRDDVVFGSTVSGRPPELAGVESMIGLFLNTLPVRVVLRPGERVLDLLRRVQAEQTALLPHHYTGLAQIQHATGAGQLFDTLYVLQNMPRRDAAFEELVRETGLSEISDSDQTHYPLTFVIRPDENGYEIQLAYRPDKVDDALARRTLDSALRAVRLMAARPEQQVGRLRLFADTDLAPIEAFNDTALDLPATSIATLFEEGAQRWPERTALVFGDIELSFAELNARINRLARVLIDRGVGPETLVAIGVPRSVDSVVALFAVLKAGAGYVPLELDHPAERLAGMLVRSAPAMVLVSRSSHDRVPGVPGLERLVLDAPETLDLLDVTGAADITDAERTAPASPDAIAYTIYTSGSTGEPKGVAVPYRGLTNMLLNHRAAIFDPVVADAGNRVLRIAHTVSFSFDMSWEELLWLVQGHEVHLMDEEMRRDSLTLTSYCAKHAIDVINVTPSYCAQLVDDGLLDASRHRPCLVLLGGEAVSEAVWERLAEAEGVLGYNLYGPTEYTINALGGGTHESATPTVGGPIANTRALVLDTALRPVAVGVPGELYLDGVGLARGYAGRPDLTAERFVANPAGAAGSLVYRTGDLVRWRADGRLDFLGRTDDQVKIRGFRIEPGEVESELAACAGVAQAAIAVREDVPGAKRLIGYVVPARGGADLEEVRADLARRLPAAMVPAALVELDALPLTVNGKLDQRALPAPEPRPSVGRPPRDERETALCAIFAEVLGLPEVTVDDDFFVLGGHSLLAMRAVGRIRKAMGVRLTASTLVLAPTVARLAAHVADTGAASEHARSSLLPLREGRRKKAVFCFSPGHGVSWGFAGLAPYIEEGRAVYGLQPPSSGDVSRMPASTEEMAHYYLERIRAVQPEGPYHLVGWSYGGQVAYTAATLLREAGERVGLLALLDTFPVPPLEEMSTVTDPVELEQTALSDMLAYARATVQDAGGPPLVREQVFPVLRASDHPLLAAQDDATLTWILESWIHIGRLMPFTEYRPYDGDLVVFTAKANVSPGAQYRDHRHWGPKVAGTVVNHDVNCDHDDFATPAVMAVIGPVVAEGVENAEPQGR
ncbi:amino acid adenylation domain-containing protein [Nocardiopsis ansamitocini]|uniref:amino acid adenylation domain-containing protein n=1 Tax=Nocardiopsis ansamitocini TaxID=1670832 RepID=UPI002555C939|nr:amino acid adenylation domain-containing protein [Nocardiopsis ansamitocini]